MEDRYTASIHLDFTGKSRENLWALLDALEELAAGDDGPDDGVKLWTITKEVSEG